MDEAALSFEGWTPEPDLARFLRAAEPQMSAQLARNASSHAFDGAWAASDSPGFIGLTVSLSLLPQISTRSLWTTWKRVRNCTHYQLLSCNRRTRPAQLPLPPQNQAKVLVRLPLPLVATCKRFLALALRGVQQDQCCVHRTC